MEEHAQECLYSFRELLADFIAGTPIKRKPWGGYWKYRYGKIEMHGKNGATTHLTETNDILFTISHIMMYDWEIATNENCEIPVI